MDEGGNGTWAGAPVRRDPLYIVVPMTVAYGGIFVTGLLGNLVTCLVIARNKHMHTPTNYYLFSLAISDLLLLVTGLPPEIYLIWYRYPYVFGEAFCVARGLAAETCANATVLTITAFTVERYVAICHPFWAHTASSLSRALRSIVLIWFVAFLYAALQALQFGLYQVRVGPHLIVLCGQKRVLLAHSFEVSTLLFFVAPMTLITVLYVLIGLKLRKTSIRTPDQGSNSKHHTPSQRVLRMLVAVVVAFFVCWAPFHAQRLVAIYGADKSSPRMLHLYEIITYLSGILYYFSATVNPILYHIMSHKYRQAFKETIGLRGGEYSVLSRGGGTDSGEQHRVAPSQPAGSCWPCRRRPLASPSAALYISNSSLKDVDRAALGDELRHYLTVNRGLA